jgi:hypothetical protein
MIKSFSGPIFSFDFDDVLKYGNSTVKIFFDKNPALAIVVFLLWLFTREQLFSI